MESEIKEKSYKKIGVVYLVMVNENSFQDYVDSIFLFREQAKERSSYLKEELGLDVEIEQRPILS